MNSQKRKNNNNNNNNNILQKSKNFDGFWNPELEGIYIVI